MRLLVLVLLLLLPASGTSSDGPGGGSPLQVMRSRFPFAKVANLPTNAPPVSEYACTSLDGPWCPSSALFSAEEDDDDVELELEGAAKATLDRKVQDLMRRVLKAQDSAFSAEGARVEKKPAKTLESAAARENLLRAARDVLPAGFGAARANDPSKSAVKLEKARLEREKKKLARDARETRRSSSAASAPRDDAAASSAASASASAVASAARDARCDVCRALTRDAVRRLARHGDASVSEDLVEDRVRLQCAGDLPRLMKAFAIVPRPAAREKAAYALAERDGESGLTRFEVDAFRKVCDDLLAAGTAADVAEAAMDANRDLRSRPGGKGKGAARAFEATEAAQRVACADACPASSGAVARRRKAAAAVSRESGKTMAREAVIDAALGVAGADASGCAYTLKGWWAYEVCRGERVTQYHVEFPGVASRVSLGEFEARVGTRSDAFLEPDEFPRDSDAGRRSRARFVEERFLGGTTCAGVKDPRRPNRPAGPGLARRATVRWTCADGGLGDQRVVVRETRPCVYDVAVHDPELCRSDWFVDEGGGETPG